jgi:RNA polymerase sigma factor (sigma-70 family)
MMDEDGFEVVDDMAKNPADVPDARAAMQLLRMLDDIYREVITLRFVEGLTPKEISGVLEVSENVVSVRLHRGIERLRTLARKPPKAA